MGAPMAAHIAKAGYPLIVWNRTPAKARPLITLGAKAAKSPAHAAAEADVVITMVSRPQDVEDVVLGPSGALEGLQAGAVLVDMSTVSPVTSRKLAGAVATKHAEFLDAPVVGSKGPATDGTLVILVGGLPPTLKRCEPILRTMGKTIIHAGNVGCGSALKLATNLMLGHLSAGFVEALILVQAAGLDPQRFLEVVHASPFASPWYQTKGVGMLKGDFTPHFALKHMRKDFELMCGLAKETRAAVPVTEAIRKLFAEAESAGKGELDYSAILAHLQGNAPAVVTPS